MKYQVKHLITDLAQADDGSTGPIPDMTGKSPARKETGGSDAIAEVAPAEPEVDPSLPQA